MKRKLIKAAAPLALTDRKKRQDQLAAAHAKYAPTIGDRLTAMQAGEYYQLLPPIPFRTLSAMVYSWMQGNFTAMWDTISVMLDTWPMFLENQHSLRDSVAQTKFVARPFAVPGADPTASAQRKAAEFNIALGSFDPVPGTDEKDLRGTIYHSGNALVMPTWQYVLWDRSEKQFVPRATVWVHTRFLGFDGQGRFGFRQAINPALMGSVDASLHYPGTMEETGYSAVTIPENRGICSVYDTRSGSITMSGFVRPLTKYWGGMYYGYQWMLRYAEMFGQPTRIAYVDPNMRPEDQQSITDFLANMGANPWAKIPNTAKFEWHDFHGGAGADDPKRWLQQQADEFSHLLHFGETGTSSFGQEGQGSGRAHGEVMERTRRKREEGVASWMGGSNLRQLARAWNILNYGTTAETPVLFPEDTTPLPPSEQADTIQKLDQSGWEVADDGADPAAINQTMTEKFALPLRRKQIPSPESRVPSPQGGARSPDDTVTAAAPRAALVRARATTNRQSAVDNFQAAMAADFAPVVQKYRPLLQRLETALAMHAEPQRAEIEHLRPELEAMLADTAVRKKILAGTNSAELLEKMLSQEFFNSLALAKAHSRALPGATSPADLVHAGGPGSGRRPNGQGKPSDSLGRWVDDNGGGLSEHDNIARGQAALNRSLNQKTDVQNAMYRKEVGAIHFQWGRPGETAKDYEGGYGIAHIAAKHPDDLKNLPETIAKGKFYPHESDPDKRYVAYGKTLAVLGRENKTSAYVVTGLADPQRIGRLEASR